MALPVDSFTLAIVGMAPANTASVDGWRGSRTVLVVVREVAQISTIKMLMLPYEMLRYLLQVTLYESIC